MSTSTLKAWSGRGKTKTLSLLPAFFFGSYVALFLSGLPTSALTIGRIPSLLPQGSGQPQKGGLSGTADQELRNEFPGVASLCLSRLSRAGRI